MASTDSTLLGSNRTCAWFYSSSLPVIVSPFCPWPRFQPRFSWFASFWLISWLCCPDCLPALSCLWRRAPPPASTQPSDTVVLKYLSAKVSVNLWTLSVGVVFCAKIGFKHQLLQFLFRLWGFSGSWKHLEETRNPLYPVMFRGLLVRSTLCYYCTGS